MTFAQPELGTEASADSSLVEVQRKVPEVGAGLCTAGGTESCGHLFNPGFDPPADD